MTVLVLSHVSQLLFMAPRKNKKAHRTNSLAGGGGGFLDGGKIGKERPRLTAGTHTCTHMVFKKIWETPLTSTMHPTDPTFLCQLRLNYLPSKTAPEGRASRRTSSARPASGSVSVCVYLCQASLPNRCDQSNQVSTCCVNHPAPKANTHKEKSD